jgi:hypothetical protein
MDSLASCSQLEEELNIYLNNGIKTFGPLLGKALKAQLHPELSNVAIDQSFPLKLVYLISGRQYIGTLQVLNEPNTIFVSRLASPRSDSSCSKQSRSADLCDDEQHSLLST